MGATPTPPPPLSLAAGPATLEFVGAAVTVLGEDGLVDSGLSVEEALVTLACDVAVALTEDCVTARVAVPVVALVVVELGSGALPVEVAVMFADSAGD